MLDISKHNLDSQTEHNDSNVVLSVKNVSKRFCRDLKKSMLYGIQGIGGEIFGAQRQDVELRKGEFWALKDVNLELRRGEALGLVGTNGAGKTTLLRVISGLIAPDHGSVEIKGRVAPLIALGAGFNPILTGRENIYVNMSILGLSKKEIDERFDEVIDFAEIGEAIDSPVQTYSSGMGARLGFACAIHTEPDILLIDEVLAVGDVRFQSRCFNKIGELRQNKVAIIMVTHNLHHVSRFCPYALYLNQGKAISFGDSEVVISQYMKDLVSIGLHKDIREGSDFSEVNGSGKMIVKSAKFFNLHNHEINEIKSGDPVILRVLYECNEVILENIVLDVMIRDQDGILFQGSNNHFNQYLTCSNGKGYIDMLIKNVNSNNQTLDFFVALWSSDMNELYDWKRYIKLNVLGHPLSSGRVLLDCTWSTSKL